MGAALDTNDPPAASKLHQVPQSGMAPIVVKRSPKPGTGHCCYPVGSDSYGSSPDEGPNYLIINSTIYHLTRGLQLLSTTCSLFTAVPENIYHSKDYNLKISRTKNEGIIWVVDVYQN